MIPCHGKQKEGQPDSRAGQEQEEAEEPGGEGVRGRQEQNAQDFKGSSHQASERAEGTGSHRDS